jgi:hypothetical protein
MPWWQVLLAPAACGLLVGLFIRYLMPNGRPQGVADVIESAALHEGRMSLRHVALASLANAASIGGGASVGREGPVVLLGAGLASAVGKRLGYSRSNMLTLLGCGVAAAVAASFNAPLAGALFALEVVVGHYRLTAFADERGRLLGHQKITKIEVQVLGHVVTHGDAVHIIIDGRWLAARRIKGEIGQAGFFARLAQRRLGDIGLAVSVPANLQPAMQALVPMQERALRNQIDDCRRCRDMPNFAVPAEDIGMRLDEVFNQLNVARFFGIGGRMRIEHSVDFPLRLQLLSGRLVVQKRQPRVSRHQR